MNVLTLDFIHCYRDRNEELKKEIEAQERSFKTQLATAEQKSRDLWVRTRTSLSFSSISN